MSDVRDGVVKIVKGQFGYILHTLRSMQNKNCVVFNQKEFLANFLDIKRLINLFTITVEEIGISEKDYEDVQKFIFFK